MRCFQRVGFVSSNWCAPWRQYGCARHRTMHECAMAHRILACPAQATARTCSTPSQPCARHRNKRDSAIVIVCVRSQPAWWCDNAAVRTHQRNARHHTTTMRVTAARDVLRTCVAVRVRDRDVIDVDVIHTYAHAIATPSGRQRCMLRHTVGCVMTMCASRI